MKIAVCVPSTDMVHADFALSLAGAVGVASKSYLVAIVSRRSARISQSRNSLFNEALTLGAEIIVCFDSDMVFPACTLIDLAHHADRHGAAFAGYCQRNPPYEPVCDFTKVMPLGCAAIHADILGKMRKPYFKDSEELGEDEYFSRKLMKVCKPALLVELSKHVGHIGCVTHRLAAD